MTNKTASAVLTAGAVFLLQKRFYEDMQQHSIETENQSGIQAVKGENKMANVVMETQHGTMKIELYPEVAPITVAPLIFNEDVPVKIVPSAQLIVVPA